MVEQREDPQGPAVDPSTDSAVDEPLLVEDVLLLLFQPSSGTIAGEGTLFYVLGGAVITELALCELTEVETFAQLAGRVTARGEAPPDEILRSAWEYITQPRDVQTAIAAIGPELRSTVLDRLVADGHVQRERKKLLGFIPSESLTLSSGRRADLLAKVRATLVDGVEPDPRTAAITALLSASANLHQFDPDIPWTTPVIERAKQLEIGHWGATAAGTAVTLSTISVITGALLASTVANAAARE